LQSNDDAKIEGSLTNSDAFQNLQTGVYTIKLEVSVKNENNETIQAFKNINFLLNSSEPEGLLAYYNGDEDNKAKNIYTTYCENSLGINLADGLTVSVLDNNANEKFKVDDNSSNFTFFSYDLSFVDNSDESLNKNYIKVVKNVNGQPMLEVLNGASQGEHQLTLTIQYLYGESPVSDSIAINLFVDYAQVVNNIEFSSGILPSSTIKKGTTTSYSILSSVNDGKNNINPNLEHSANGYQ